MIGNTVLFLFALSASIILQVLAFDHNTFEPTAGCTVCNSTLQFSNPAAKKYEVGNQIPFLPFKMKTTWAGNIPIADQATVKNASLYFWMMGKDGPTSGDDLLFWLNGGPGCASTTAAITENGPFFFQEYGQGATRPNPYSWTKAASIVYVNYPFGVAFTTGNGNNVDQEQISQQFLSFLQNFYKTFPELQSKNIWLVGESVAGKYVPYILDAIRKSKGAIKKPKGVMLIDPLIGEKGMISDIATYPFSVEHQKDLNLTQSDLDQIKEEAESCGMIDYVKQNLFYPPKGKLPDFDHSCAPSRVMHQIEYRKNETFNVYNFKKPDLSTYAPSSFMSPNMFYSSPQVQQYIHAPPTEEYVHCKKVFGTVFGSKTDTSLPVDRQPNFQHSILAQAIEESEKFTIIHGDLDALYLTQGTELALQNLTWSNQQGFKSSPTLPIYNMEGEVGGSYTKERGLLYANIPKVGHKVPRDDPSTGLAAIMDLLGQQDWTKP